MPVLYRDVRVSTSRVACSLPIASRSIPGAASGIGLAVAQWLGEFGMRLVIAVEEEKLARAADDLRRGAKVHLQLTDVSDRDEVEALSARPRRTAPWRC